MKSHKDITGRDIQVFAPSKGTTLVSPYTPLEDEVVMLGSDVTITIDGISVDYTAGSVIGLALDTIYTLSLNTLVHKM